MKITGIICMILLITGFGYAQDKKIEIKRFAVFVGANDGGQDRIKLRFAVSDARSMSRIFKQMGGLQSQDQILLVEPRKEELKEVLNDMHSRLEKVDKKYFRREFIFYYSGHSDDEGILLGTQKYDYKELKNAIKEIPTDMCIVILDSCASGAFTRIKGGQKRPPFLADSSINMEGYAFLTSSSSEEVSQESDTLGGSFFTHYLVSGLRGAADDSQDRRVSLNEAYQYAYHETLARTEKTISGAQHPNYDIQIKGSGEVVMTDIRETSAGLKLDKETAGKYFVRDKDNKLIAEINKSRGRQIEIGLEPGEYKISWEKEKEYYTGGITLSKGEYLDLTENILKREDREETVSRGLATEKKYDPDVYVEIPFVVSVFRDIAYPGYDENKKVINSVHLSLVLGECDVLNGVGLSVGGFAVKEEMNGVQLSGFWNQLNGHGKGVQISTFGSVCKGNFAGVQSSFYNKAGSIEGVQSGLVNNADKIFGVQYSLVNLTKRIKGVQAGIVNLGQSIQGAQAGIVNLATNVNGWQAGIVNLSGKIKGAVIGVVNIIPIVDGPNISVVSISKNVYGPMISTVNLAQKVYGPMISAVNIAEKADSMMLSTVNIGSSVKGPMLGVVNISGSCDSSVIGLVNIGGEIKGTPIGLVNVYNNIKYHYHLFSDEMQFINFDFQQGKERFYNIFKLGMHISEEAYLCGYGIGLPFNPGKKFTITAEFSSDYIFADRSWINSKDNWLFQAKLLFGFKMFNSLYLTAGLTYNFLGSAEEEIINVDPLYHYTFNEKNRSYAHWPGFSLGMKF